MLTVDAFFLDNVVLHVVWMLRPSHMFHNAMHSVLWDLLFAVSASATVRRFESTSRPAMHSPFSRVFWIRSEYWPLSLNSISPSTIHNSMAAIVLLALLVNLHGEPSLQAKL